MATTNFDILSFMATPESLQLPVRDWLDVVSFLYSYAHGAGLSACGADQVEKLAHRLEGLLNKHSPPDPQPAPDQCAATLGTATSDPTCTLCRGSGSQELRFSMDGYTCRFNVDCPECNRREIASLKASVSELEGRITAAVHELDDVAISGRSGRISYALRESLRSTLVHSTPEKTGK